MSSTEEPRQKRTHSDESEKDLVEEIVTGDLPVTPVAGPSNKKVKVSLAEDSEPEMSTELEELATLTNVDILIEVGSGGYGVVYLGTKMTNTSGDEQVERFAVKVVRYPDQDKRERVLEEVSFLRDTSDHPNFVRFYQSWELQGLGPVEPSRLIIKMEYVKYDLFTIVEHTDTFDGPFTFPALRRLAKCLIDGLTYLHGKNIVHHDIKEENIMVQLPSAKTLEDFENTFEGLAEASYKIIDFGLAERVEPGEEASATSTLVRGTTSMYSRDKYNCEDIFNPYFADAYAVGCVFLSILTIEFQDVRQAKENDEWQSARQLLSKLETENEIDQLKGTKLLALLYHLLAEAPEDRVFLSQIKEDDY